ncbi:hypothetical protein ACFQU1_18860 [Chelatococcus sp. GCM10030263]|uniref:hypothetical protein n=1 Tax=Chelatococcus sp. GCM10030263 TaxID=3273387 RepID=UPI00360644E2
MADIDRGQKEVASEKAAVDEDRRVFLAKCGRFAVITPPAMTVLLSTTLNSTAIAKSGGGQGNNGRGNGGGDGVPGNSGHSDAGR